MRTQIDLERTPDSAAQARRALSDVAEHLTPRRLEDARLLVSELVTNAIRHAGLAAAESGVRSRSICVLIAAAPGSQDRPRTPVAPPCA